MLLTQHGPFRAVDDGLLSWQVAQWLSYGARGIGIFTYWTPAPDPNENWTYGMIHWGTGERSPHYERVRSLNQIVRPIGETLAGLTWLATEHAGGVPLGGTAFAPDPLVARVQGRATLGEYASPEGRPYLFVANRDSSLTQTIAVDLVGERTVESLGPTGEWSTFPSTPTEHGRRVEITCAPGGFALFRLGGGCYALVSGGCRISLETAPEPARGGVRFSAQRVSGVSTLSIVDASGRRVWSHSLGGEAPVYTWDGRDQHGQRVVPGIYWARLEDDRGAVVRRFTWLGRS